jgi:transposase
MLDAHKREAIFLLHQEGMGLREIARRLGLSRNTVRSVIAAGGHRPASVRRDKIHIDPELLQRLYGECNGFVQRVHEKLVEEEKIAVKYSTLTRLLRELGIGRESPARCDRVPDVPGAEMQHDTSPYTLPLAGHPVRLHASLLYLRYSKRRYLKFYRNFNRFRMKCFFHEALMHWGYCAPQCIIDNTNLARLRGTGKNAVMAPEMAAFSKQYGFEFLCHERGHHDRKAGEERGFWTVETNFFPGRHFQSLEDLNEQAFQWATQRMEHRPVGKGGLIPAKAFEHERLYLVPLPPHLPAPYLRHDRGTDQYGYVALDANYYWVPGTQRHDVCVLEYSDRLQIYRGGTFLIEYMLPPDGVKNKGFSPPDHRGPRHRPHNRRKPTDEEEKRLRALAPEVGAWLDFALEAGGNARHRAIRELFRLSQQMTPALFVRSLARALKYRIRSVETIRRIALMYLGEGLTTLPSPQVDENVHERDAYVQGHLSEEPNFSAWEGMLDEDRSEDQAEPGR